MTAMPIVKPVVTGCGTNCISLPRRASPMITRITPAIIPATSNPATPNFVTIGTRITTNAAVGPVTCERVPPSSEHVMPATIAV